MKTALFALALFLSACTGFSKPTVALAGIDIASVGLLEQRFVLKLRVNNPNDFDIPVEGLDFAMELNGQPFAQGVSNTATTVPRRGEAVLEVKTSSNLAHFLRQWREVESKGEGKGGALDYRLKGKVRVAGYGEWPFEQRGEVPLPRLSGRGERGAPAGAL